MGDTKQNLLEAFAGESQANRKYLAFAEQADKEGHPQAARLFRAAAAAETVHAHAHLRAMGGIGNTAENLKEAISGETHEFKEMYPGMIETAASESNKSALRSFENANAVEAIHARLYQDLLDNLEGAKSVDYYVCNVCGNTVESAAPETCPICGAKASAFVKTD